MPGNDSSDDRVREAVRGAILSLSSETGPCDLTVTSICRTAGVSRGAFYGRYAGLEDALDDVLDHILSAREDDAPYRCIDGDGEYNCPYGICDIVLEHPEYGPILFDEGLAGRVADRISALSRDKYVRELVRRHGMTPGQAGTIFDFQLNGCLAINRKAYGRSPFCIGDNRDTVGEFIRAGLTAFGGRD